MMNLNLTFLGQMLTFIIFVLFTMRYVWPPIMKAIQERQEKIADGLTAAEQGRLALAESEQKAEKTLNEAKNQAGYIIENANKRAHLLVDEAKDKAHQEGERILNQSKAEIDKEMQKAKLVLKSQVASIALLGAEKILRSHINEAEHAALIEKLITEI